MVTLDSLMPRINEPLFHSERTVALFGVPGREKRNNAGFYWVSVGFGV
jgi:hypothetical protein